MREHIARTKLTADGIAKPDEKRFGAVLSHALLQIFITPQANEYERIDIIPALKD